LISVVESWDGINHGLAYAKAFQLKGQSRLYQKWASRLT